MTTRTLELDDLHRLPIVSDAQLSPDGTRVAYVVTTAERETDRNESRIWVIDVDGGTPRPLTAGPADSAPRWSPDGRTLAFLAVREGHPSPQLWLLPLAGGEARRLTEASLGAGAPVWSPDGGRIAYVGAVTIADRADHDPIVVRRLGYKADGVGLLGELRRHVAVVDVGSGESHQVTEGDLDVAEPAWSPDGGTLAVTASTRPGDDVIGTRQLLTVPASGGPLRELVADESVAGRPVWSPDGRHVLFVGLALPAMGHTRLWLVEADDGARRPVAASFDRNVMVGGPGYPGGTPVFSNDGGTVVFAARDRGCTHLFAVDLASDEVTTVVAGDDRVAGGLSSDAQRRLIAFVSADPRTCGEVHVARFDGSDERRLTDHVASALPDVTFAVPQPRRFTAPDGTAIHGWVVGDAEGPAPLLLDIHGGPHNAWNPALDPAHLYQQVLVAAGWRVLMLNPRASDGYGESFYRAAIGAWGRADLGDFTSAVDALVDEGLADPSGLAVCGYSYGGYMTNWITTQTDRFAAAVSGGCVSNLVSYAGTADMGPLLDRYEIGWQPDRDASLATELSPLTHANRVTTPTLILHGEADHRCPVGQAEEWFAALRTRDREVELVRYPGAGHLFILQGRPSHRVDYAQRTVDWVTDHVKPRSSSL